MERAGVTGTFPSAGLEKKNYPENNNNNNCCSLEKIAKEQWKKQRLEHPLIGLRSLWQLNILDAIFHSEGSKKVKRNLILPEQVANLDWGCKRSRVRQDWHMDGWPYEKCGTNDRIRKSRRYVRRRQWQTTPILLPRICMALSKSPGIELISKVLTFF